MLDQASLSKPQSVQQAVTFLWVSVGLLALLIIASWLGLLTIPGGSDFTRLLSLAFMALVASNISAGRNWARWLFAVTCVLGYLFTLVGLLLVPQVLRQFSNVLLALGIAQFALQTAALFLLFTDASRYWFSTRRIMR
jgi:hypothetical protein